MSNKTILSFAMLFVVLPFIAQKAKYVLPIDAATALKIVKEKNLLYQNSWLTEEEIARTPSYQPQIEYIAAKNQWKVISKKHKTIHKKRYKKSNGITLEISMTVILDANTGKIVSKKKRKKKYLNYE